MNELIAHSLKLKQLVANEGFPFVGEDEEKDEGEGNSTEMVVDWLNTVGDTSTDSVVNFAKSSRAYTESKKISTGISETRLQAGGIEPGLFQTIIGGRKKNNNNNIDMLKSAILTVKELQLLNYYNYYYRY